jgi:hypothetical protein
LRRRGQSGDHLHGQAQGGQVGLARRKFDALVFNLPGDMLAVQKEMGVGRRTGRHLL